MIAYFSKENKLKRYINKSILSIDKIINKYNDSIDPDVLSKFKNTIDKSRNSLRSSNLEELHRTKAEIDGLSREYLSKYSKSKLRQNIEALLFALMLAFLIRTFVVQPFKIPSGSMIPTLLVGDHLLVNKFIYGTKIPFTNIFLFPISKINRGDVAVFIYPNYKKDPSMNDIYYIKRVIGIPGDRIDINSRNLIINGEKIPITYSGTYLNSRDGKKYDEYIENLFGKETKIIFQKGQMATNRGILPVIVPDGYVFVMGDNRDNSRDSRFWGFVPIENIAGKAFITHWSWDFNNSSFFNKVRWDRILSPIN